MNVLLLRLALAYERRSQGAWFIKVYSKETRP